MPIFGQHETSERLHLSGVGGVYGLKADGKKIIKVILPPAGIWSEEQIREEIDGFLLRAKTQKALAKGSGRWAPVYETGTVRGHPGEAGEASGGGGGEAVPGSTAGEAGEAIGAYAVMDRYERSVQSLIDGRVNITNDDLRNIMSGAVGGLLDIQKTGRPHGNLKATNILLGESANLAAAKVFLSDPAPDGALAKNSAAKDLADLGRILFFLVNLKPYDGGTIPKTREWTRLGPNGEDWRKLCTTLLDAHAPAQDRALEKILADMGTWTAKPRKNKAPVLIAASVLVLAIAGGGAAWYFTRPPKLDFNEGRWEELCLSYAGWFNDFSGQMSDANMKQKYASAPYPTDVAKAFGDYAKDMDKISPQAIAKQPSRILDLAVSPTDDAKTGYGPYYTQQGDKLIEAVEAALTPEHWQVLGQLDKTAKDYDGRGWGKPAAGIRSIIAGVKPPELPATGKPLADRVKDVQPVNVAANIDNTIKAANTVREIDAGWARIQADLKQLPAGAAQQVPLVKALPQFAQDFPKSEADPNTPATIADVTSLSAAFKQIDDLIKQVSAQLSPAGKEIDYAQLAQDPGAQIPSGGALTIDSFKALPQIVPGYIKIAAKDDPTKSVDWQKNLDDIQNNAIAIIQKANARDQNLPKLKGEFDALAAMKAEWEKIPAIEKNRSDLAKRASEAQASLKTLTDDAHAGVAPYIIDPKVYLAQQRERLTSSPLAKATPVVYTAWKEHQNALIGELAAAGDTIKTDWQKYQDFDQKFNGAEKAFEEIDALIPTSVASLATFSGNDWRHVIAAHVMAEDREETLKQIIAALQWPEEKPQMDDPAFVSARTNLLKGFDQTCKDADSLIGNYTAIAERLDRLDLLPGEPAAGAQSWSDFYTKWQQSKNPLMSDEVVVGALKPINDRVTALLAVQKATDYKELLADTASPAAEIVLMAWRKLGTADVSQDLPVLDDEDKAEAALAEKLSAANRVKMLTDAHLQAINAEIAAQRPVRWRHWAAVLSAPAAIQKALDEMASFKVTLTQDGDPAMFYNQALYGLDKDFAKNPKEAELKPIAQQFINAVNTMPAAVKGDKDIQDLLARMSKSLSQSQEESSSAGAGPKLAGWEQETPAANDAVRLFYFPSKSAAKYTLEFDRLQVDGKTIFLGTTEMPLGLFADAVKAYGKFSDIDNATAPDKQQHWFSASNDPWKGPRVWKISGGEFVPNTLWLFPVPQMGSNPFYPANGTPPAPSADMPMQALSPWSALYGARLLGCRLPTSDEWQAAYEKFEKGNAAAPKDAWNLRGKAWSAQQDYARTMANSGLKYADDGIFLTGDQLFAGISSASAKPWMAADLAKLAPVRINSGGGEYGGSVLWFRKVGAQPGAAPPGSGTGAMHDLVGNVAEYVFDGAPDKPANAVVKNNTPTPAEVDATLAAQPVDAKGKKQANLFVIGGSSLSPPAAGTLVAPFDVKVEVDRTFPPTASGFCDVGFRLAYTAPIDSIADVLTAEFKAPHYLPGAKAKRS